MDCKYFNECSASMCPKDENVSKTFWYPGEEICRLQDIPDWVKRQKKITKANDNEDSGCFTLSMLKQDCMIKKGITGINPESEIEILNLEKEWIKRHPVKKPISEEKRAKMRVLGQKNKARLALYRDKKSLENTK